ncbi:hypothetical protein TRFO_27826 [Tritrichomonas foetus]|uniref:Ubiquitin-like domain-containing protein n=1 Tax=Tritrichomonas foetus TaxID=1144522 RepID=A0A1J4K4D6_9EUKA|nr:hypothetical protein TRFO_27826 [Tritrichomonas foetus]|eukprot:OHT04620.1 hypothetical protein TRFO_27826 [Tritrichomonas foetus]
MTFRLELFNIPFEYHYFIFSRIFFMKCTVLSTNNDEFELVIGPTATVSDIKQLIQIQYNVDTTKSLVIFHNKILLNTEKVGNYLSPVLPGIIIELNLPNNSQQNLSELIKSQNSSNINNNVSTQQHSEYFYNDLCTLFNIQKTPTEKYLPVSADLQSTLKETFQKNGVENIDDYYIYRVKQLMSKNYQLYQFRLHKYSRLIFETRTTQSKMLKINFKYPISKNKVKKYQTITYNISRDTYIIDIKKALAFDLYRSDNPSIIKIKYRKVSLSDDRQVKDYHFVNNQTLQVNNRILDKNRFEVGVECLRNSFTLILYPLDTIIGLKQKISHRVGVPTNSINIIYNHEIVLSDSKKVSTLSNCDVFAVQMRLNTDPVYAIEFQNGLIYYLDIPSGKSILWVKKQIRYLLKIPVCEQCITYHEEVLDDNATMGELSIPYYSTLICKKQKTIEMITVAVTLSKDETFQLVTPDTFVSDLASDIAAECPLGFNDYDLYLPVLQVDPNMLIKDIEHNKDSIFVLLKKSDIIVNIQTVGNDSFMLPLDLNMTVEELKLILFRLIGYDVYQQRIFYKGKPLTNLYKLKEYKIVNTDIITVFLSPYQ